jgi:hypothetical protein
MQLLTNFTRENSYIFCAYHLENSTTICVSDMSDDLDRGERLQIMLSPTELSALDDFRFKYRMPSRAAAIRELLRRGLVGLGDEATPGSKSSDFGVLDTESNASHTDSSNKPHTESSNELHTESSNELHTESSNELHTESSNKSHKSNGNE